MRTFDEIYADVPEDQREALRRFRESYPEQTATANGMTWRYVDTGGAGDVILLLVGGLREADAAHANIPMLTDDFRVIAPSYPTLSTMADLADGVAGLLDALNLERVHVLAGSFGGMLAQVFIRRHPERVNKVILSTTAVLDEDSAARYNQALEALKPLSQQEVSAFAKETMFHIMQPPKAQHAFYRAYLDELYSYRVDKAALISMYHALLDFAHDVELTPGDWDALILEADDDATFDETIRARVRELYPHAMRYVFHNAGHSPAASQRDHYFDVVKRFLQGADLP
jgi:pimeloyl-ACP methyl ester carboxylesterase